MPYIKSEDRSYLENNFPRTESELNYRFTLLLQEYIKEQGEKYATFNVISSTLDKAKMFVYFGDNFSSTSPLFHQVSNVIRTYLSDKNFSIESKEDIIGALVNCSHEFYRRKVAVYENLKIEENGDVY